MTVEYVGDISISIILNYYILMIFLGSEPISSVFQLHKQPPNWQGSEFSVLGLSGALLTVLKDPERANCMVWN